MTINLKRLRALAEAADRGEWESTGVVVCTPTEGGMKYLVEQCHGTDSPNLEYIASANPDVLLQLIDRIERLESRASEQQILRTGYGRGVRAAADLLEKDGNILQAGRVRDLQSTGKP